MKHEQDTSIACAMNSTETYKNKSQCVSGPCCSQLFPSVIAGPQTKSVLTVIPTVQTRTRGEACGRPAQLCSPPGLSLFPQHLCFVHMGENATCTVIAQETSYLPHPQFSDIVMHSNPISERVYHSRPNKQLSGSWKKAGAMSGVTYLAKG